LRINDKPQRGTFRKWAIYFHEFHKAVTFGCMLLLYFCAANGAFVLVARAGEAPAELSQVQAIAEAVTSIPERFEPATLRGRESVYKTVAIAALWFGMVAGLVEGAGLLLFQRINWEQWGISVHVARPILWISPIVDVTLFLLIGLAIVLVSRPWPKLPAFRAAVFAFSALTLFDWLLIPHRLYYIACLLLPLGVGVVFSRWANSQQLVLLCFWRRTLPVLGLLLIAAVIAVQGGSRLRERRQLANLPAATPGSPNVLVILIDTLRADHVSSYGYSRATTPNIDRLAREGVLFENAVSTSSWSFPPHVSLLTGEYPHEHSLGRIPPMSAFGSSSDLIPIPMIGEELERRGYRTGAFSSNRIFFDENLGFGRGFVHFEDCFFSVTDMALRTVLGRELGRWLLLRNRFVRALNRIGVKNWIDPDAENQVVSWGDHLWKAHPARKRAEQANREVLNWIDGGPSSHPFFIFVNYFDVHAFYGGPASRSKPSWEQDRDVDQYDNGVHYVDECIAQLLEELGKRNLTQNTLVVITSDHGELLGEHGLAEHGQYLYWNLIHVPLILWQPEQIPAGSRVPGIVSISRLPATLSSWLPGERDFSFPGASLATLWGEPTRVTPSDGALAEFYARKSGDVKSTIAGCWHFITHKKLGDELYDWRKDAEETKNLIGTPEGKAVAAALKGQLLNLLSFRNTERGRISGATVLDVSPSAPLRLVRRIPKTARVNDYYLVRTNAGSVITFEVQVSGSASAPDIDSVLALEDENGKILDTCRNPEDDNLPAPAISDATPNAFDDVCVNDHVKPGVETVSRLEVQVPGKVGATGGLYVHVTDWNGSVVAAGTSYAVSAKEASAGAVASLAPPVNASTTESISASQLRMTVK
jgi:arylsulfatase A-like enzyme